MKLLRYTWALPNTLLGLLFIPFAFSAKGGMRVVDGVLELYSKPIAFFLRYCFPMPGGVAALTLGHVVLGRSKELLSAFRLHERVHVRQYEILGPLFIPVYLAAGIWAMIRGRNAYWGNYLERQAFKMEKRGEHDHENC
jgi:hypothetical protein